MKLLIINHHYADKTNSGTLTQNLAEMLANRNHEISVLTTTMSNEIEVAVEKNVRLIKIPIKTKNGHFSTFQLLSWLIKAKRFLKKHLKAEKYQLCLAFNALPAGELAFSMKEMFRLPYIIFSQGYDIPWILPEKMMWLHATCYQWIRKICMQAELNFVNSNSELKNLNAFLSAKAKINVATPVLNDLQNLDFSVENKQFTILYNDVLDTQGDPFTFLTAIDIVRRKIPSVEAIVLGKGRFYSKIQAFIAKNHLENHVKLVNCLDRTDMQNSVKQPSLIVDTNLLDAVRLFSLNALLQGNYIIANENENIAQLVAENINGNLFKQQNINDLAEKIILFYHTKFLQNYSIPNEQIEILRKKFNQETVINWYEEIFKEVIDNASIKWLMYR